MAAGLSTTFDAYSHLSRLSALPVLNMETVFEKGKLSFQARLTEKEKFVDRNLPTDGPSRLTGSRNRD